MTRATTSLGLHLPRLKHTYNWYGPNYSFTLKLDIKKKELEVVNGGDAFEKWFTPDNQEACPKWLLPHLKKFYDTKLQSLKKYENDPRTKLFQAKSAQIQANENALQQARPRI